MRAQCPFSSHLNTDTLPGSPRTGPYGPPPRRYMSASDRKTLSQLRFTVGRLARILRQDYGAQRMDLFNCHVRRKGCNRSMDRSPNPKIPGRNGNQTRSPPNPSRLFSRTRSRSVEHSEVSEAGHSLPIFFAFRSIGLIRCRFQEEFRGEVIHAFEYKNANKYLGKKVLVVGAATSGHDVAFDLANNGVGP